MTYFERRFSLVIGATAILLFLLIGIMPYQNLQQLFHFNTAEAGEEPCIDYNGADENTITVNCDSSFLDVVQTIDDPDIIENLGNGEYLLNANLEIADDVTFEMSSYSSSTSAL